MSRENMENNEGQPPQGQENQGPDHTREINNLRRQLNEERVEREGLGEQLTVERVRARIAEERVGGLASSLQRERSEREDLSRQLNEQRIKTEGAAQRMNELERELAEERRRAADVSRNMENVQRLVENLQSQARATVPFRGGERSSFGRASQVEWPTEAEGQVQLVSELMSRLESLDRSYSELAYNPDFLAIQQALPSLSPEVRAYFSSRIIIYEAGRNLPAARGNLENLIKLGEAIQMPYAGTMLHQKDVARAFMELERRARLQNKSANPARADNIGLERIYEDIAKQLARERNDVLPTEDTEGESTKAVVSKYIWAVRQADTLWRIWGRAAIADGIVFKEGTPEDVRQRLSNLRPGEMPTYWGQLQQHVDWKNSFEGNGEAAFRRLFHSSLHLEKSKSGEAVLRPYVYYDSKDFLSNFINKDFLTKADNFEDGIPFEIEGDVKPGDDQIFKKVVNNIEEKVVIKRNGFVQIEYLDTTKVRWRAKGDTVFGGYDFGNLVLAENLRKNLVEVGKLLREPTAKNLLELEAAMDRFDSIEKDIQLGENPNQKRAEGKVYREDAMEMLAVGALRFMKEDRWTKFKVSNADMEEIDRVVNLLRSEGLIRDEQVEEIKKKSTNYPRLLRLIVLTYNRVNPPSVLLAMLSAFIKQAVPLK